MSIRVVISDTATGTHPDTIQSMILAEHTGLTAAEIEIRVEGFATSVAYAESIGAEAVVRSITGLAGYITDATTVYPDILCFVPMGSNSSVEITPPTSVPVIVTCGAGDTDNDTAYGPGLEFWDLDADANPSDDASSYANGRICGKILRIKDYWGCSWVAARDHARRYATGGYARTDADGYGKIDLAAALATKPIFPADDPGVVATSHRGTGYFTGSRRMWAQPSQFPYQTKGPRW